MAGAANSDATLVDNHTPSSSSANDNNNKLYKGVRKRKWGKWVSEIRLPNSRERIWLGSFDSPEKAARAFDAALYCLRGRHANFNFPDTPFNLEINNVPADHKSLTPQQIREIAAKFANENPPQRGDDNITATTTTTASSSSTTTVYEYDHGVQVDHGDMSNLDWTFLNDLDHDVPVASDYYGLYSELDKMHSGELLYPTPLLPNPFDDNEDQNDQVEDPFSHQAFLWNWNF